MRYTVMGLLYANTTSATAEADTPDDAIELASDDLWPSLCHQCSDEVELGDIYGFMVYDANDKVVHDDAKTWQQHARAAGWTAPAARVE